jgi:hypothetical protein
MENEVKKSNIGTIIILTVVICLIVFVPIGMFLGTMFNNKNVSSSNSNNQTDNNVVNNGENVTNTISNVTISDEDKVLANDIIEKTYLSYITAFVIKREPGFDKNVFDVKINETLLTELSIWANKLCRSTTYEDVQNGVYVDYKTFTDTYYKLFNKQYQYVKDESVFMGGFGFQSNEGVDIVCNSTEEPCYVDWNATWSFTPYNYGLVPLSVENNVIKGNIVKNKCITMTECVADESAVEGSFEFEYGVNDSSEYYVKSFVLHE